MDVTPSGKIIHGYVACIVDCRGLKTKIME